MSTSNWCLFGGRIDPSAVFPHGAGIETFMWLLWGGGRFCGFVNAYPDSHRSGRTTYNPYDCSRAQPGGSAPAAAPAAAPTAAVADAAEAPAATSAALLQSEIL